jgi:ATP-dependent NAD(P)H-hydrate dehydratase
LKAGADISHIFCSEEAAIPIKSYSPEFIVHPCLNDPDEMIKWMDACTSIVIGPGLGRDESTSEMVRRVLGKVVESEKVPLVGDADFLWYISNSEQR